MIAVWIILGIFVYSLIGHLIAAWIATWNDDIDEVASFIKAAWPIVICFMAVVICFMAIGVAFVWVSEHIVWVSEHIVWVSEHIVDALMSKKEPEDGTS